MSKTLIVKYEKRIAHAKKSIVLNTAKIKALKAKK